MTYKNTVLKSFSKFTGKRLCRDLFLKKFHTCNMQLYLKRVSDAGIFLCILWNFSEQPFW